MPAGFLAGGCSGLATAIFLSCGSNTELSTVVFIQCRKRNLDGGVSNGGGGWCEGLKRSIGGGLSRDSSGWHGVLKGLIM